MQKINYENNIVHEAAVKNTYNDDNVAVIGMNINMPFADNLDDFWEVISKGINCVGEFQDNRKKNIFPFLNEQYKNDGFRDGAYLEEIDLFDYEYYDMTPKEANLTSPLQRLILNSVIAMLDSAGYRKKIIGSNTGIYTAAIGDIDVMSYKDLIKNCKLSDLPLAVTGNMLSMINGRLTSMLDLKGPAEVIDTACSSALVAIHKACMSIKAHECEMAIVCSGRIHLVPSSNEYFSIGIESEDGNTRTFDQTATGSGFGEGIGSVLLKSLDCAKRDGDYIYAVINGSAVNQDGASMGLTVPNPAAQKSVINQAWEKSGINPENITYIECHGTATPIGDPIEIDALTSAFRKITEKKQFCAIGSLKSNYGHLLECAGMASFIKAVLCLNKHEIPPTINIARPNKDINFIDSPLYINTKLEKWDTESSERHCGVSSFGLSGVNCHVVLSEFNENLKVDSYTSETIEIITMSARTSESLNNNVENLREFLKKSESVSLRSLVYMENINNCDFRYRLAIIVESIQELVEKLDYIRENWKSIVENQDSEIYIGESEIDNSDICLSACYDRKILEEVALSYVKGKQINWAKWYSGLLIPKIPVPSYAFGKEKCWIKTEKNYSKTLYDNMYYHIRYIECKLDNDRHISNDLYDKALLFSDKSDLANEIAKMIPEKNLFVMQENKICNPLAIKEAYKRFLDAHEAEITTIIFVSCKKFAAGFNELATKINLSFYNMFLLVQVLYESNLKNKINIIVLTDTAYEVDKSEKNINSDNAPIVGFCRTVNSEFSNIRARVIDVDCLSDKALIFEELKKADYEFYVAIRNNRLFKEELDILKVDEAENEQDIFSENNVILITGGIGHIGLKIAESMITTNNEKIILVSRSGLPEKNRWEEIVKANDNPALTNKIKAVLGLESKCREVEVLRANVSEEKDVCSLEKYVREKYGKINTIVHAAGITGNGLIINRTVEQISDVINPKVMGTWLLEHYFSDADIFINCSSGVSLIGEVGLADYAAANAYLDSFAHSKPMKVLTVNWVVWKNARMMQGESKNIDGVFEQLEAETAIACLHVLINKKIKRAMIGKLNSKVPLYSLAEGSSVPISDNIMKYVVKNVETTALEFSNRTASIVCEDPTNYSEVERTLKEIVSNVLEYDNINVYDNFFEIGGNSILLNKVWTEIDEVFPNKTLISDLFAYPSIHDLTKYIIQNCDSTILKEDDEDIDAILESLDESSDIDEILKMIEI